MRRLAHVLLIILTSVVGAAAAAIVVTETTWFKDRLRGYIVRQANESLNGELTIDRLTGNLLFGVELDHVGISMDGGRLVDVKAVKLGYSVFKMIAKGMALDELRLDRPTLHLRRDPGGWLIARLVKPREPSADTGRPISVDRIAIDGGAVVFEHPVATPGVTVPKRIDHVDAKLSLSSRPSGSSIDIAQASFEASQPSLKIEGLSGAIGFHDGSIFVDSVTLKTAESSLVVNGAIRQYASEPILALQAASSGLSVPEIGRLVPAVRAVRIRPAFTVKVSGPLDRLELGLTVRSPKLGRANGELAADLKAPGQSVHGAVSVTDLNLEPAVPSLRQPTDITATARVDVRSATSLSATDSLRGAVNVEAPAVQAAGFAARDATIRAKLDGRRIGIAAGARAYGATVAAKGGVTLAAGRRPLAYDIAGELHRVDLRRLPRSIGAPPARSNLNVAYRVTGTGSSIDATVRTGASRIAGARIARGGSIGLSRRGRTFSYAADTTVASLDLQRLGRAARVAALASDRYASDVNGRITASGRGTDPNTMSATAQATLTGSSVFGAKLPQMTLRASFRDGTAQVAANGAFSGLNPAGVTGDASLEGEVSGRLDVQAKVPDVARGVKPAEIEAGGAVTLQRSTVAGLEIDDATIDASYADRAAEVRAFEVHGRELNAAASGEFALSDTGRSNLQFRAEASNLERIGPLLGRPLSGTLRMNGIVTGNAHELRATGSLVTDNFRYGGNGALTLSSNYDVRVPEFAPAAAAARADTQATFVSLGGQRIDALAAKTAYSNRQLAFQITARQGERAANANGRLLLHADRQALHLERLDFRSRGVEWRVPAGTTPTISHAGGGIAVADLTLVDGAQQISARGSFGGPGESLQIALDNVRLAGVDALLLRPPQLAGTLDATAKISGTAASPDVAAQFRIDQGGFRQFQYQSLAGTVSYARAALAADVRFQQNPEAWLTAKGSVPMALFRSPGTLSPAEAGRPVDLHVDSSPIDLGLVEGVTTAVTHASGVFEAHANLTGTAARPDLRGTMAIQNGAFTVAPTGAAYSGVDGAIDFQRDRVHIAGFRLVDSHQQPLSISGDLGLRGRQVGGVNLAVKADDFTALDNDVGKVRIKSDLSISGDVRAPRVTGSLGVTTGQVDLDPILALAGQSAYSTAPAAAPRLPAPPSPPPAERTPAGGMSGPDVNVHLTVPDDLVVKSSDLRLPGSAFGFGSLNVTLGGDVRVRKPPGSAVRLVGSVRTVRGTYDFQGRRFAILRDGTVRFEGLPQPDPRLDITAQRTISGVQADVHIRGTLRQPRIELSSVPPLEQADILSLVVFNQPINQLGEGQQISVAERAQSMAAGAVAGELAKSIGGALNLDTFEIRMAPATGSAAQLALGQQLGQNLYAKLEQGVGQVATTNFILEYELTDWLRLQTNLLEGSSIQQSVFQRLQGSGVDLIWFFSY